MDLMHHDDIEFMPGDTWTISAMLKDRDGTALDITNAELSWTLITPDGERCRDVAEGVSIIKETPNTAGIATITVPNTITTGRRAGRYTDAMRVVIGTETDLVFHGILLIGADPFAQPLEPVS